MTCARLVLAASLLPLLLVAGCGEDPQPRFAPSSPSAASSSATSEPAPQRQPWEKRTEAGAVAFAKHWVDVFNAAQRSGDTGPLRALSADACESCENFRELLEDIYSGGGRLTSEGWSVKTAVASPGGSKDQHFIALRVLQSRQTIKRSDGGIERYPGGEETFSAEVQWREGWHMSELVLMK